MTPDGYALAFNWAALAPLGVRVGLMAFLSDFEPHPAELLEAVKQAHSSGLLRHDTLTPEGRQAVRLALADAALPPRSIRGPRWAGRRQP